MFQRNGHHNRGSPVSKSSHCCQIFPGSMCHDGNDAYVGGNLRLSCANSGPSQTARSGVAIGITSTPHRQGSRILTFWKRQSRPWAALSFSTVLAFMAELFHWCPRGDSNPYDLRRYHLKVVRLPVPPPGQVYYLVLGRWLDSCRHLTRTRFGVRACRRRRSRRDDIVCCCRRCSGNLVAGRCCRWSLVGCRRFRRPGHHAKVTTCTTW